MKKNATQEQMERLHGKLASAITDALDDEEFLSPALFTVATKFLKDNDITCQAEEGDKLNELDKKLKEKREQRLAKVTPLHPDMKAATL